MNWADAIQRARAVQLRVFGRSVGYNGATITAIWSTAGYADPQSKLAGELMVRLSDLAVAPAKEDAVTIDGKVYEVRELFHPDDSGMQRLGLRFVRSAE